MSGENVRIIHRPSGELLAEGSKGWGMFSFEGNVYIAEKNLKTKRFQMSWIPGLCFYKFIYFWYHFQPKSGDRSIMLGWKYWLPNLLFPLVAYRIGIPKHHPEILVEEF